MTERKGSAKADMTDRRTANVGPIATAAVRAACIEAFSHKDDARELMALPGYDRNAIRYAVNSQPQGIDLSLFIFRFVDGGKRLIDLYDRFGEFPTPQNAETILYDIVYHDLCRGIDLGRKGFRRKTTRWRGASTILHEFVTSRLCRYCHGVGYTGEDHVHARACPHCDSYGFPRFARKWRADACSANYTDWCRNSDAHYQDVLADLYGGERYVLRGIAMTLAGTWGWPKFNAAVANSPTKKSFEVLDKPT